MPSKSLIASWTTSFGPSSTRLSHSRRNACPGNNLSLPPPRRRVLSHLHGLWKGTSSSKTKCQLATSDPMLRRASSTISIPGVPGVTLASRPSPTASSLIFSPASPTTPASLPSGVDTGPNAIKFSEAAPARRGILSDSFDDLSPTLLPFSGEPAEPAGTLELSSYCTQPVLQSLSLPSYSPLPHRVTGCPTAASGNTLDAATRLEDFRALIDELRATLLHHDSEEEFDTGKRADDGDGDERERLIRLLEDVMRKVQRLAENDATRIGPQSLRPP